MLLLDAHLDLSINALEWNRDLRLPAEQVRAAESGKSDLAGRGRGTVTLPEMRAAGIGVCVATQIGGCMKPPGPVASWESPAQAWALTQGQLAWYRAMEAEGLLRQLRSPADLRQHLDGWNADPENMPIGYVLSLEGADSLIDISHLERAYEYGLRAIGPAHYGVGRYAHGHDVDGEFSQRGRELIAEIGQLGLILDLTHLCERSFWQALDLHSGALWASHHNCRALVDDPRQLSDAQIEAIIERGSVIGVAFDAWMLAPGWQRGSSQPAEMGVTLETVADHIDHICQLAGNAKHVGIGSDLDGGFGTEQSPSDLNTIADLPRLAHILAERGYSEADVERVMYGNFLEFLLRSLPG